jgi:hypothetical protein
MLDQEFTKWLLTLGVGGALAAFTLTFYRKDVKQYTELWRATTETLMLVVRENTASNVRLIALLETVERNQLRKGDIDAMIDRRIKESVRWEEYHPERGEAK